MASSSASPVTTSDEASSGEIKSKVAPPTPPTTISQTPTMDGPQISEVPSPSVYPSYEPNTPQENISRGGFGPLAKQKWNVSQWANYPPLSNDAYSLDTNAYHPKPSQHEAEVETKPGFEADPASVGLGIDGLSLDGISKVDDEEKPTPEPSGGKTKGEILADKIDFKRSSWVTQPIGSVFEFLPPNEQRREFIELIDKNKNASGEPEPCFKCDKRHIIPGSPLTLGDRDRCYSALPDWFPLEGYKGNPWDHFTMFITELAKTTEIMEGRMGYRDPVQWDLHFHDKNKNWTTEWARRYGGWWKCRSDPDAPELEQNCQKCHQLKTHDEIIAAQNEPIADKLRRFEKWMEDKFKEQGQKDKEAALAKLKKEGIPQHMEPPMNNSEWMSHHQRLMGARGVMWGGRPRFKLPEIVKPELDTTWRDAPDLSKKEPLKNHVEPMKPTQPGVYSIWLEKRAPMPKESPNVPKVDVEAQHNLALEQVV